MQSSSASTKRNKNDAKCHLSPRASPVSLVELAEFNQFVKNPFVEKIQRLVIRAWHKLSPEEGLAHTESVFLLETDHVSVEATPLAGRQIEREKPDGVVKWWYILGVGVSESEI